MKAGFYLLIGLAALALSACSGEQPQTKAANPEKMTQYTKQIVGKWHFDRPFMDREIRAYHDTVFHMANAMTPGLGNPAVGIMEGQYTNFSEEIKHARYEFRPDGKWLAWYFHSRTPYEGSYAFSDNLDSLFIRDTEGNRLESYKLASISNTSFVLLRDLYLPTKELKDMTKRRFYKIRCKYVPE